jgi:FkbM family methyltransferase
VRGRTRVFLELYRLLRLSREHVVVDATLSKPVPYSARLDLHSWSQRIAFLLGGYEPSTTEFILRLQSSQEGDGYLLDVGANVGLIAIPFALSTSDVVPAVVAVEAVPDNVKALQRNITLNGLEQRIQVLPIGLGDEPKKVYIQVEGDLNAGEGTGTANILPDGSTYECVRQELQIERLDDLAESGRIPTGCAVIKIDTDGYDLKVLQGATAFLRRERPVIFGEFAAHCMAWHGQSIEDIRRFVSEQDYLLYLRREPGWQFTPVLEKPYSQDLLLVPAESKSRFHWCLREP